MIFQKLIQKFSTLPDKSSLQNHSSSPLFLSLSPNPKFSPLRIQFHTRKRNQRITPANFFPQRVSIRERFESAPYKIPSGQLRSPSEIRNDPPSKNPPHFITVVHLPNFLFWRRRRRFSRRRLEIFHRPPSHYNIVNEGSRVSFNGGREKNRELQKFPHTFPLGDACTRRVYPIFTQLPVPARARA